MADTKTTDDETPADQHRRLADEIARDLFTAGARDPVHCDKIWLYIGERRVAGWSERGMADVIADHLQAAHRRTGK